MKFKLYEGRRTVPHTKKEMGVPIKEPKVEPKLSDSNKISFHIAVSLYRNDSECDIFYESDCEWDIKTGQCAFSNACFVDGRNQPYNKEIDFQLGYITFNLSKIDTVQNNYLWFSDISNNTVWFDGSLENYPHTIFYNNLQIYINNAKSDKGVGTAHISANSTHVGQLPSLLDPADISGLIRLIVVPMLPEILSKYKQSCT